MRVFISSRFEELYNERKKTIEVLHSLGHTPLSFHTPPECAEVSYTIKELSRSSEALVVLFYLSLGNEGKNKGYIIDEFDMFRSFNPCAPILFLTKTLDESIPDMIKKLVAEQKKEFKMYWFRWGKVSENEHDKEELTNYIAKKYDINWVKEANIENINETTIKASFEKKYLLLKLNNEKNKVTLEIDNRKTDEFITKYENNEFNVYTNNIIESEFKKSEDLVMCIEKYAKGWEKDKDGRKPIGKHMLVRYTGPDFIGLIKVISEILFTEKINIDYISHASRAGTATIYISCSPRAKDTQTTTVERSIRNCLKEGIKNAEKDNLLVDGAKSQEIPNVNVCWEEKLSIDWQFYIELITIDTPGQIFELCEVLQKKKFNIDNMHLSPTSREYPRQTSLSVWVSYRGTQKKKKYSEHLFELESAINDLSGMRVCSIRYHNFIEPEGFT